ncbi:MAG: hypothetical protein KatS3mg013_0686 [Actinomycetota bacterium]|jgi:hypothetical protein|nr:MAG: hypothetical protein KatS3mg013_0686 [Actinomycetota bacterium]
MGDERIDHARVVAGLLELQARLRGEGERRPDRLAVVHGDLAVEAEAAIEATERMRIEAERLADVLDRVQRLEREIAEAISRIDRTADGLANDPTQG